MRVRWGLFRSQFAQLGDDPVERVEHRGRLRVPPESGEGVAGVVEVSKSDGVELVVGHTYLDAAGPRSVPSPDSLGLTTGSSWGA